MLLYHCTTIKALSNILKNGIMPLKPLQRNKIIGVYLSQQHFKWAFNVGLNRFGMAHLEIDTVGLKLIKDYHNDARDSNIDSVGDYICLEKIESKRIKKIFISSDEEPNSFKRIYKKDV